MQRDDLGGQTGGGTAPADEETSQTRFLSEDWWAVVLGCFLLGVSAAAVMAAEFSRGVDSGGSGNPLQALVPALQPWVDHPCEAVHPAEGTSQIPALAIQLGLLAVLFGLPLWLDQVSFGKFLRAFVCVYFLAVLAFVFEKQAVVEGLGLEFPLWAVMIGMIISHTVGTPSFVRPALRTEFYIKSGLVLLGAEILLGRLLEYGVKGIVVSWVTTPIVLVSTYLFGQKILSIPSKTLNITIAADMSVCGVSAAIATAAACRAKKEELSLAIGISLAFTAVMMVAMPAFIRAIGMDPVLGGAWIGGTIDATGAVAAAGAALGEQGLTVATTIKMIQNILIGVIAFVVALYWTRYVEARSQADRPSAWEIWHRFPKFVLGFAGACLLFSYLNAAPEFGPTFVKGATGPTKLVRGWLFCLGFVSIGLETNFRELAQYLRGGKPVILYVCGQSLNLALTLFMAWLMFAVLAS